MVVLGFLKIKGYFKEENESSLRKLRRKWGVIGWTHHLMSRPYREYFPEVFIEFFLSNCWISNVCNWNRRLENALARVVAMDLGLETELFNELLLSDAWLVALGGLFVMVCMCLYTGSIFITLMTCTAVIFTLALAYSTYTLIFRMSFFPYMNLLAVVVIIG